MTGYTQEEIEEIYSRNPSREQVQIIADLCDCKVEDMKGYLRVIGFDIPRDDKPKATKIKVEYRIPAEARKVLTNIKQRLEFRVLSDHRLARTYSREINDLILVNDESKFVLGRQLQPQLPPFKKGKSHE